MLERGRLRGHKREDGENDDGGDHEPFAAEQVRQQPEGQRADRRADQAGGPDFSELRHRQFQLAGNRRRGIADGLRIEAVERRHQHAQHEDSDLIANDRVAVDEFNDVDFDFGHGALPPALSLQKSLRVFSII